MNPHHCAALACHTPVAGTILMCPRHWRMVSPDRQRAVRRAYRSAAGSGSHLDEIRAAMWDVRVYEEWVARAGDIPALTLWQPFGSAIIAGEKDVENRTRRLQRTRSAAELALRPEDPVGSRWIAIHAGAKAQRGAAARVRALWPACPDLDTLPRNAVLGCVRVAQWEQVGVASEDDRILQARASRLLGPWATGPWCAVVDAVVPLPAPMACGGKLGLWSPPPAVLGALVRARRDAGHRP